MENKRCGGARPGAGRKKGQLSVSEENRAKRKGISLPSYLWTALETEAAANGIAVSALIRRQLDKSQDTEGETMDTNVAKIWGECIAILESATHGSMSPMSITGAVERPLTSLAGLMRKANLSQEMNAMLQERMAQIPDLPENLPLKEQGAVWLGYYRIKGDLPCPRKKD